MTFKNVLGLCAYALISSAPSQAGNCYYIGNADSPERSPVHAPSASSNPWCYFPMSSAGKHYTFIFQNSQSEGALQPELAGIVELNAAGKPVAVRYRSRRVSIHEGKNSFNPMPVPLTPPQDGKTVSAQIELQILLQAELDSAFQRILDEPPTTTDMRVEEGETQFSATDQSLPFKGYWWSFNQLELASGEYSPLGKYDRSVEARTGSNPKSVEWEKQYHSLQDVEWGGHCNGWAASALLFPEPTRFLWDTNTQKIISPSDQKGMLAEASYCTQLAFYGHRYYGAGDDLKDIYPALFHQVLMYYIRDQKEPVVMDYYANEWVDNHVISGYRSTLKKTSETQAEITYDVETALTVHGYEKERNEDLGTESRYEKKYHYTLVTDLKGNPVGGEWISENPDFLWVPLATDHCEGQNPQVDSKKIVDLIQSLPDATPQITHINFNLGRTLGVREGVEVPITPFHGTNFRIHFEKNNLFTGFLGRTISLFVTGHARYPDKDHDLMTQEFSLGQMSEGILEFNGQDITGIQIQNKSLLPTAGSEFAISTIEFLGGR